MRNIILIIISGKLLISFRISFSARFRKSCLDQGQTNLESGHTKKSQMCQVHSTPNHSKIKRIPFLSRWFIVLAVSSNCYL